MKITMVHGSGGKETSELITSLFVKYLGNPVLARLEDSAVVPGAPVIAMTTDSFVVTPLFFPGGDIGKLAVCGTVNDLSMSGAIPKYLTCGFIIEEGAETGQLEQIVRSMAKAAQEAGVIIVAGDTKVIEGKGGIYINTAGVGFFRNPSGKPSSEPSSEPSGKSSSKFFGEPSGESPGKSFGEPFGKPSSESSSEPSGEPGIEPLMSSANAKAGDVVILSGNLGDHHATILSARMNITNAIQSDCAPLNHMAAALMESGAGIRTMRDVTRGGLATVLHEIAVASSCCIRLQEEQLPVSDSVRGFCGILGLDPLYMANEGKMIAIVAKEDAEKALSCMRENKYGQQASLIGEIGEGEKGLVLLHTMIGGTRIIPELYGEGLPRIC